MVFIQDFVWCSIHETSLLYFCVCTFFRYISHYHKDFDKILSNTVLGGIVRGESLVVKTGKPHHDWEKAIILEETKEWSYI